MKVWLIAFLFSLCVSSNVLADNTFNHGGWDQLLQKHVRLIDEGKASQVDYQGFLESKGALVQYLKQLESVDQQRFDSWAKNDQLAFLINAYNAWTVQLILTKWPDLDSIKDLGGLFRSPWRKEFIPLLGQVRSLDEIEHELIRGSDRYQDPRIHFAVNCASIGCPALANVAYQGDSLEQLLEQQTRLFLADRSRNRLDGKTLKLSSIFKWYKEDFEKGWQGYDSLESFLVHYKEALSLPESSVQSLMRGDLKLSFLSYDWGLNGVDR